MTKINLNDTQKQWLITNHLKLENQEIEKYLKLSPSSLWKIKKELNLPSKFQRKQLDNNDIQWLKDNINSFTEKEICCHLKISTRYYNELLLKHNIPKKLGRRLSNLSEEEIKFIETNIDSLTKQEIISKLNISDATYWTLSNKFSKRQKQTKSVTYKIVERLNTPITKEYIDFGENFINVTTPFHAYILGFIWADGYVCKDRNRITCSIGIEDGISLKETFLKTGKWHVNENHNVHEGHEPQMIFTITNKIFREYLIEKDYIAKSWFSADKIISQIPHELKYYWWRGLLDGDGNIHTNCIRLHSGFDQDWFYVEKLSQELGLTYRIDKWQKIKKNGEPTGGSCVNFCKDSSIIFGNYIYKNRQYDKIGLDRKYNEFLNNFNQKIQ